MAWADSALRTQCSRKRIERSVSSKRVLVTGAAGVIGRQLTSKLLESGAEVLSVDREPMPPGNWVDLHHEQADLSEMDLEVLTNFAPTAVFHLAASFERSEESAAYWSVGWRDDVVASHRVIGALARQTEVETFVFASSYLVYDPLSYLVKDSRTMPVAVDESTQVAPRNLCGAGKYYTERELRYVGHTSQPDLRVVNARIFRVFGRGSRDVISRWVRAGIADQPIEVFNRSNRFDYLFADDVAETLVRLEGDSGASGIYNVGSGRATSIDRVLAVMAQQGIAPQRISDTGETAPFEASVADISRLRAQIGWTPDTTLEEGIEALVEHELAGSDV